jgi:hypothetical protein
MELIHTEIDLEAPSEPAWRVLMDFGSYGEWNPFLRAIEGNPVPGGRLTVEMELPVGKKRVFRPRVTRCVAGEELRWLGHLGVPGLLDGEHAFVLERFRPDRVRFFQRELFSGLLVPVVRSRRDQIEAAFVRMNEAFKARVENGVAR